MEPWFSELAIVIEIGKIPQRSKTKRGKIERVIIKNPSRSKTGKIRTEGKRGYGNRGDETILISANGTEEVKNGLDGTWLQTRAFTTSPPPLSYCGRY
ncbi:hypothetical protein TNCV_4289541 [Trichonephila clavipes]|nr:hypothetical protein TNCV_4289541 [Trichonephila clavipes]